MRIGNATLRLADDAGINSALLETHALPPRVFLAPELRHLSNLVGPSFRPAEYAGNKSKT